MASRVKDGADFPRYSDDSTETFLGFYDVHADVLSGSSYPLSPGGRYVIDEAFCMAASVSSTVSKTVV